MSSTFSPLFLKKIPIVLAKQAEKKAILEKIEQGKKAKNNKKRLPHHHLYNNETEPLLKRPKLSVNADLVSNTPSPMTLNSSSRPASVLSTVSTGETLNGEEPHDFQGSTDGSEVNLEVPAGPGSTPIRKPAKSRQLTGTGGGRKLKRTTAPLGGRGKMQKSGGKGKKAGLSRSVAAASAGAIAGAKAATSAAYAAYGIPSYHISPSPSGSPAIAGSTHSSPRVSPVPMAFVATSLVSTPPTNTPPSKVPSSLAYAKSNL